MHIMHYNMHNLHYDMHILENYQAGIYFKRTIYYGKWQHIKLKGTKKHPPWSADSNDVVHFCQVGSIGKHP